MDFLTVRQHLEEGQYVQPTIKEQGIALNYLEICTDGLSTLLYLFIQSCFYVSIEIYFIPQATISYYFICFLVVPITPALTTGSAFSWLRVPLTPTF